MINRRIEQFKSGNFELTGQWDEPIESEPAMKRPGVIFCHGFTGNKIESRRLFALLSRRLAIRGFRTFRFDHRGCGDSEGDFADFDAAGLLEDLDAALKVFSDHKDIDPERTAVVGYSLGGLSASYLLGKRPEFKTGVLWAPVAQPDIIKDRLATYPDFSTYQTKGFFDYMGIRVSASYIDNIGKLSPVEWAKSYKRNLLFIQGSDDNVVKPAQVQIYLAQRAHEGDELLMIPQGDHFFGSADNLDLVLARSEEWLAEKILG